MVTRWKITLESNPLDTPRFDRRVTNPFTGQSDILVEYEQLTLMGEIEAEVEYSMDPKQDPAAFLILAGGIKIPMCITKWVRRRL